MKTKFLAVVIFITALFTSCKDEKSTDPAVVEENKDNFKVEVNVTVKKDDNFSIFYTEDGTADFTKIQPIWVNVKGSDAPQDVVFELPSGVYPTQLRLDFGLNKEQGDMVFNAITFKYLDKTKRIAGADLGVYFRQDDNKCTYDYKTGVIKALVKDNVRMYPSLYPHEENLGGELKRLIAQK